jgi:hypothetical protein
LYHWPIFVNIDYQVLQIIKLKNGGSSQPTEAMGLITVNAFILVHINFDSRSHSQLKKRVLLQYETPSKEYKILEYATNSFLLYAKDLTLSYLFKFIPEESDTAKNCIKIQSNNICHAQELMKVKSHANQKSGQTLILARD